MVFLTKQTFMEEKMPTGYHHLTRDQRCQLAALKERGDSVTSIAIVLGVHHSTLYRELARNGEPIYYDYNAAQNRAFRQRYRASTKKPKMTIDTIGVINDKLALQWSPVQISGWLKKHGYRNHVSYETIYQHVWKDKRQGGRLYKNLRHRGKVYNKRSKGAAGRGCIPNRKDIDERPEIVQRKTRLGDWEIDTIIGRSHQGAIVSMVERRSRFTKLALVHRKRAFEVSEALFHTLHPLKDFVHTLTSDNGKEFAYHEDVSIDLDADFYFAKPYHSWERGLNEHTNGLVRQYFPKKMKFTEISKRALDKVEFLLNTRPRKVLNFAQQFPLKDF